MDENPTHETARERARRIWRNSWIQKQVTIVDDTSDPDWERILDEDRRLNNMRSKLTVEINKIINQKNRKIIENYKISIQARRRRLLREKLRRLQESHNE
jgi:hypothetical protein